jgi:GntR family histidine utilization transcriptional repressor
VTREKLALHQRIRRDLTGQIRTGGLRPGDRIPFEHELMARYDCARMTVNKALSALAEEGLIERRKRAGSFVRAPRLDATILDIPDIEAEVARRGESYVFRLQSRRVRPPGTPDEAAFAGGGDILALEGLHFAANRPLAFEERLISLRAVPAAAEVDFDGRSPGHWLLRQVPWTRAEHQVSAEAADSGLARRTGWARGTACLVVVRRTWRADAPVTHVRQTFDGSAYRLSATLDQDI